jgi:hypothetical protein
MNQYTQQSDAPEGFDNRFTGAVFSYSDKAMRGSFVLDDESEELDAWFTPDGMLTVKRGNEIVATGTLLRTPSENPKAPTRRGVLAIHGTDKKVSVAVWKSYRKSDVGQEKPYLRIGTDKPLVPNGRCFD